MFKKLFVFDIETVPDVDCIKNLTNLQSDDTELLRQELENYHLEITNGNNPFPRQLFHKVITISFASVNIELIAGQEVYTLEDVRSGGTQHSSEQELVKGFFNYLEKHFPRIVSFNGRGFDIPVLKYRAMKYGITANKYYNSGDKWNNYSQRYSKDWHCDLLEVLSEYGTSARIKMNEICAILNIPGKIGTSGSQVMELYDQGNILAIRNYCETDVLNTYLIYLRHALHQGLINLKSYNHAVEQVIAFLNQNNHQEHFQEFLAEWEKVAEGNFIFEK